jgi:hypothetical protein
MPLVARPDLPATSSAEDQSVRVDFNRRGAWDIGLPGQTERVTRETLAVAQRVAYLCAARRSPCELIVHDAYHRVLRWEVIDWTDDPALAADLR